MQRTHINYEPLDRRLMAAADFVRRNAVVADIGTDHAYLPVFLIGTGKAKRGIAADINEGPVLRAKQNVRQYKMEDRIEVVQTDGLTGLDGKGVTDIAICGMGGELISKILDAAPFVKDESIRLILQPMTKSEDLYRYLCKNGFSIVGEALVREDRIYRVICAEYTGKVSTPDDISCLLGEKNIENRADLLPEYAARRIAEFTKKRNGMKSAGLDTSYEDKIISNLEFYAKAQNN